MQLTASLRLKTIKGFFWQLSGNLLQNILQLVVIAILARLISKNDFGLAQLALVVIGLGKITTQLGIGPALVQIKKIDNKHITTSETFTFVFSLLLGIIVFFTSNHLEAFFKASGLSEILKVCSVIFLLEGVSTISSSIMLRAMRQKELVMIDFFSYSVGYGVVATAMAWLDYGVWSLVMGQVCQSLLKLLGLLFATRHIPKFGWSAGHFKELIGFGGWFTAAHLCNYSAGQADNVVVGKMLGTESLGVYGRAYNLMVKPVELVGSALDKALFPAMARRQDNLEKVAEVFIAGSRLILIISIPISVLMVLLSDFIVMVLLGDNWSDVVVPLQILSMGLVFRMGYKMGSITTKALGEMSKRTKVEFMYAISMVVFCFIGTKHGLNGVAFGVICSIALTYMMMITISLNALKIGLARYFKQMAAPLALSSFIGISYVLMDMVLSHYLSNIYLYKTAFLLTSVVISLAILMLLGKKAKWMQDIIAIISIRKL